MSTQIVRTIPILLSIARIHEGGNAGNGRYFFTFDPHPVQTGDTAAILDFQLSKETPKDLVIESLISSDALQQLGEPLIDADRRRVQVENRNTAPYLMQLALVVRDNLTGEVIVCDPQVVNTPPHVRAELAAQSQESRPSIRS
ncbi:hypothetical protein [Tahibacter amnicola]|uniref:Uncharacterized protein n=1 Tax=Tahibacter amnicola TaxID=2976241 RepID=A0ABY6BF12_9GAMM|nr:hypothetical protein [Tahibacter amnicola]UXI67858.1 hypothetical protein N4264_24525 [Tahibacter amnicola]